MASSARRVVIEFLGEDKSASRTARSVDGSTSKLGTTFKKVGAIAATGLAIGIGAAAVAMKSAVTAAMEDQASAEKLATSLRNTTGATDEQIASVEDWITKQSLATGVADDELRPAFQRLAEATGDVTKAQDLLTLAQDVSAGTGKSLESVSTALMKAQNGQVSSLARLGINTKNAKGETLSFHQATKEMADTFGGQAAAKADTFAGKMDRLKVGFDEAKETVGYALIPILTKLMDVFIDDIVPAVAKASEWFKEHLQPTIEEFAKSAGEQIGKLVKWFREHWDEIKEIFRNAVDIVKTIWDRFGENLTTILKSKLKLVVSILRGAFDIIKGIFKIVSGILHGDWAKVWDGIKDVLRGAKTILIALVRDLWTSIKELFKMAGGVLKDLVRAMWDGIKELVRNGVTAQIDLIRSLPDRIKGLANLMLSAGKALMGALFDGIKAGASAAGGFVSDLASQLMEAVKNAINSALDLPLTIDFDKGPVHIHATVIDAFAKGVRNYKGGLALVGEEGPELLELPRGSNVYSNRQTKGMASSVGGGGGGIVVNIYGPTDSIAAARELEKVLTKYQRTLGARPLAFQV